MPDVKYSVSEDRPVVVVGPGAMGSLFSALFFQAGLPVILLDKDPRRAALLNGRGIAVEDGENRTVVRVPVSADPGAIGEAGLVVVCVKAYDTLEAARSIGPLMGPTTQALSLQNGAGNVEILMEEFGEDRALGGTTAQGANLTGPGQVRRAGAGETNIGQPGGGAERAAAAAELFNRAGVRTGVVEDLTGLIWSKLMINVGINALTALLRVRNGALAELEGTREIMEAALDEAFTICQKKGIRLLFDNPLEKCLAVAEATGSNISSMLQDARAKKRTEVSSINGAVAREARALGMRAPVNQTLTSLVKALEESYELSL